MIAPITDLPSLATAVALWATRVGDVDFEAAVPLFAQLTAVRLNSMLRLAAMERFSYDTTNTDGYSTLPLDFLGIRSVFTDTPGYPALDYVTPEHFAAAYPAGGVPGAYTIIGDQMRTWPASSGPMTMIYYAKIPDLTDLEPTNWLLQRYPGLYLYGCLLEAAPFMEEDARIQVWKGFFEAAVADATRDDSRARYPGGTAKVSQETP